MVTDNNTTTNDEALAENEIQISELPVTVKAYKDANGYALVLRSEDKRIGDSEGRLVDNFLVRILGGEVPKVGHGVHAVVVSDRQTRHVAVADARIDEVGKLFVTSQEGEKYPAAQQ